ncbi:glycine betaine ABC transporter substrate-binding protein [Haloglycomyces albus]|uniref:glycine betaine ABC transporter substrate-binding protein n=1 Tax=Haloglycomyces albus TaxID=526067 RepID=UPI0004A2F567|nr:glycine betaine ABC transporter substrate-binding protein [Haloglycomyces albus]
MKRSSFFRSAVALGSAGMLATSLAACNVESEDDDSVDEDKMANAGFNIPEGEGEINLAYLGTWDENVVTSHMWSMALEEAGYDVEMHEMSDAGVIFQGLSDGTYDLFLDGWLPYTHASYMDEYGDSLEQHGVWYDSAKLTIAVPEYVDEVDSLEDLPDNVDLFDGKITGIEAGSGLATATDEEVIPTYGLEDFNHVTSSTSAMLASLDSSISNEEPILVTLWKPHWAYSSYDLKDLEDPEGALGDVEEIHNLSRDGFGEDFPEIADAMQNFYMSDEQLADLERVVFEGEEYEDDIAAGVLEWLQDNPFEELTK